MINPRIVDVETCPNSTLILTFENGEKKIFDVKPYFVYPVFKPLMDINYFNKAEVFHGTIVWEDKIDFCPDTLYEESKEIAEVGVKDAE